ncbi:hypothetical protein D6833_12735 [Candidatus Parcubacteria bacterium]|nr:MAG: hypothetical protein D6833_12735 [Candidatus Parcubacteria bacterium]
MQTVSPQDLGARLENGEHWTIVAWRPALHMSDYCHPEYRDGLHQGLVLGPIHMRAINKYLATSRYALIVKDDKGQVLRVAKNARSEPEE